MTKIIRPSEREMNLFYGFPSLTNDIDPVIEAAHRRNTYCVSAHDLTEATIRRAGYKKMSRADRNQVFSAVLDAILENTWALREGELQARGLA